MTSQDPDLGALLREALSMQEKLAGARSAVAGEELEGSSGGGAVKIKVTGEMEFRSVSIDAAAVDLSDLTMLEDLLLAALHDAVGKVAALNESNMASVGLSGVDLDALGLGGLMGGLGLGGSGDPGDGEPSGKASHQSSPRADGGAG